MGYIKGIALRTTWLNAMYSASIVIKEIYQMLHPAYVTTYPEHDMKFSALSESDRAQPLERSEST